MNDPIIGIDLGTTNSEVAALLDGHVQVLDDAGEIILPSYVGLGPDDRLIVGTPARNQYVVYPERTGFAKHAEARIFHTLDGR